MLETKYLPPKDGELKANDVASLFDNVTDGSGNRLSKSEKRARILVLMKELSVNPEKNICKLATGECVPIIVERKYEGRPIYCYFNTHDVPKDDILQAFADVNSIAYVNQKPDMKKEGELIAQEILHLIDNVTVNGKKVAGTRKIREMIALYQRLYKDTSRNVCILDDGSQIPIIVKRRGENNRIAYYLNSSENREAVFRAFAEYGGCSYLEHKENEVTPEDRHPCELTARECAKIFHKTNCCSLNERKRETKEHLVLWFKYIYNNKEMNKVELPDGRVVDAVVRRLSHSQRFLCLNTADATIKPFVIKKIAEITEAVVCFDNLDLSKDDKKQLCASIKHLLLAEANDLDGSSRGYYHSYAQKAFEAINVKTKHLTVKSWYDSIKKRKR
jgi:hypothetical protein